MAKTVVGFFGTYDQARGAHEELVRQGIDGSRMSLISDSETPSEPTGVTADAAESAAVGGIIATLVDMGVPQEDAHLYEEGVRRGGTLLILRAADTKAARRAADVMNKLGAEDIKRRGTQLESESQTTYAAPPTSPGAAAGGISPPHPGDEQRRDEKRIPISGPAPGDREGPVVTVVEEFISITKDPANREDLSRELDKDRQVESPQREDQGA